MRIKLTVAYDGTNYHGWQVQPNGITIEEVLNKALSDLFEQPISVLGAAEQTQVSMPWEMWLYSTWSREWSQQELAMPLIQGFPRTL